MYKIPHFVQQYVQKQSIDLASYFWGFSPLLKKSEALEAELAPPSVTMPRTFQEHIGLLTLMWSKQDLSVKSRNVQVEFEAEAEAEAEMEVKAESELELDPKLSEPRTHLPEEELELELESKDKNTRKTQRKHPEEKVSSEFEFHTTKFDDYKKLKSKKEGLKTEEEPEGQKCSLGVCGLSKTQGVTVLEPKAKEEQEKKDHVRFVISTPNPCEIAKLNMKTSRIHSQQIRALIAEEIEKESDPKRKLTTNFDISDFTAERLARVFVAVDKWYFQNSILHALQNVKKIKIRFDVADIPEDEEGLAPTAKTISWKLEGASLPSLLIFRFNKNRFGERAKYRITNGVVTISKLDALIVTCAHEMLHAIIYAYCPALQGHDETFGGMNVNVNGHEKNQHQFRDLEGEQRRVLDYLRTHHPSELHRVVFH